MIGMAFPAFLTLLALGLISAVLWHVVFRYRVLPGPDGLLGKWVVAWIGGWLGSPVFGHWSMQIGSLYFIPAVLGAFLAPFMVTAALRSITMRITEMPRREVAPQAGISSQFDLRKAS